MNNIETYSAVCDHAWFVEHHESIGTAQPFVTVLRGSQNYCLDTDESDVDTETILVPSLYETFTCRETISKTLIYPDNSHCGVRDIRDMVTRCWKKMSPTFLELLFSPYARVHTLDSRYNILWEELVSHKEEIARYDEIKFFWSVQGNMASKYKALFSDTPAHHNDIEKFGYSPKELCHLWRMYFMIKNYVEGKDFSQCLILEENIRDFLMLLKRGVYPFDEVEKLAKDVMAKVENIKTCYIENRPSNPNKEVEKFLNDWMVRVFKIVNERELK